MDANLHMQNNSYTSAGGIAGLGIDASGEDVVS